MSRVPPLNSCVMNVMMTALPDRPVPNRTLSRPALLAVVPASQIGKTSSFAYIFQAHPARVGLENAQVSLNVEFNQLTNYQFNQITHKILPPPPKLQVSRSCPRPAHSLGRNLYFWTRLAHFWADMMMRGSLLFTTAASLFLAGRLLADSAATNPPPDFKEVYGLLRTHLPGATDDSLNQAALAGLLAQLSGRAEIVGDPATAPTNDPAGKALLLDHTVLYLHVGRLTDALADELRTATLSMTATSPPVGTILDLRFASGDAYGAVKNAAGQLAPAKSPLIILVNSETMGAAELLAAELHDAGALLLGSPTAGLALTTEDFPLANGQRLRVATTPIQWHGAVLAQLQPDILIPAALAAERGYLANPYGPASPTEETADAGTNSLTGLLDHTSEADLVRQKRKDGDGDENPEPPVKTEPAQPVLRDPVLSRAVDLVEGLAVVRVSHL
jgi:hypothetical protein